MAPPRRRRRANDPLEPYRRIRKPMPPPDRVIPDRRRRDEERRAERETRGEPEGRAGDGSGS